jgi:hypothetical protein
MLKLVSQTLRNRPQAFTCSLNAECSFMPGAPITGHQMVKLGNVVRVHPALHGRILRLRQCPGTSTELDLLGLVDLNPGYLATLMRITVAW